MFALDKVVPWGRSFDEYCRMFALTKGDLSRAILGCADGPASFNAEATHRGSSVVSCDPIYCLDRGSIEKRVAATYDDIIEQTRLNADAFVWGSGIHTVEELGAVRMAAMQIFLGDYDSGKAAGRYVDGELPRLPFANATFDLALCSHFLFLYSEHVGEAFHQAAVRELCRVAGEVRIFPLVTLGGDRSPFVEPCLRVLRTAGHEAQVETVRYEFQRGANEMMRVHVRGLTGPS
jgi:hypothetical protein